MFTVNGSETDWLVYADYLEDQGIDASHIRELEPQTNDWYFEHMRLHQYTFEIGRRVIISGCGCLGDREVGTLYVNEVGCISDNGKSRNTVGVSGLVNDRVGSLR
jgi:hypothetical protein